MDQNMEEKKDIRSNKLWTPAINNTKYLLGSSLNTTNGPCKMLTGGNGTSGDMCMGTLRTSSAYFSVSLKLL